jgi:hypothetical protein
MSQKDGFEKRNTRRYLGFSFITFVFLCAIKVDVAHSSGRPFDRSVLPRLNVFFSRLLGMNIDDLGVEKLDALTEDQTKDVRDLFASLLTKSKYRDVPIIPIDELIHHYSRHEGRSSFDKFFSHIKGQKPRHPYFTKLIGIFADKDHRRYKDLENKFKLLKVSYPMSFSPPPHKS